MPTVEDIINIHVCNIILSTIRLTIIVSNAPTPNQNTKKPAVIISITKQTPAIINQMCHIIRPPKIYQYNYIILQNCGKRKGFAKNA